MVEKNNILQKIKDFNFLFGMLQCCAHAHVKLRQIIFLYVAYSTYSATSHVYFVAFELKEHP